MNVLENQTLNARVRLDRKERYYWCQVMRVFYRDMVIGKGQNNYQRFISASILLTEIILPTKAGGMICFLQVPLEQFHHKNFGEIVQWTFQQERADTYKVGHGHAIIS